MFRSDFDVVLSGGLPLDQIPKIGYVWKMIDTSWASVDEYNLFSTYFILVQIDDRA